MCRGKPAPPVPTPWRLRTPFCPHGAPRGLRPMAEALAPEPETGGPSVQLRRGCSGCGQPAGGPQDPPATCDLPRVPARAPDTDQESRARSTFTRACLRTHTTQTRAGGHPCACWCTRVPTQTRCGEAAHGTVGCGSGVRRAGSRPDAQAGADPAALRHGDGDPFDRLVGAQPFRPGPRVQASATPTDHEGPAKPTGIDRPPQHEAARGPARAPRAVPGQVSGHS